MKRGALEIKRYVPSLFMLAVLLLLILLAGQIPLFSSIVVPAWMRSATWLPWGDQVVAGVLMVLAAMWVLLLCSVALQAIMIRIFLWSRGSNSSVPLLSVGDKKVATGFRLCWFVLPWLEVRGSWACMNGCDVSYGMTGKEYARARWRGFVTHLERQVEVLDVMGCFHTRFTLHQPSAVDVRVNPRKWHGKDIGNLTGEGAGEIAARTGTPDGDRIDIRPYMRGDPARYIVWSILARTGRRYVRVPEPVRQNKVGVFLAQASSASHLLAREANEMAASLALHMADQIHDDALFFGGVFAKNVGTDPNTVMRVIDTSDNGVEPTDVPGALRGFLESAIAAGIRSVVVVAPPTGIRWSEIDACLAESALNGCVWVPNSNRIKCQEPETGQVARRRVEAGEESYIAGD